MTINDGDPDRERIRTAFNLAAARFDDPALTFWARCGQRTVERLDPQPGWQILDVGCGTGSSALPAAARVGPVGRVLGVDFAENMVVRARKKAAAQGLANVVFEVADMSRLDLPEGGFDAVVSVFNLFSLPDMAGLAGRFHRLLRPGGQLAVTTWGGYVFEPFHSFWQEAVQRVAPDLYRAHPRWKDIADPVDLARLLAEAGFPETEAALKLDRHAFDATKDGGALIEGSSYGWTVAQLDSATARDLLGSVFKRLREAKVTALESDVLFAIATKY